MTEGLIETADYGTAGGGKSKRYLLVLAGVVVFSFLLRFYGSWLPFFDDEPEGVVLANTISITPGRINLPIHSTDHGPVMIYLIHSASPIARGETFRYRLGHLLLGTFHILLIYWLAREATSRVGAIFAALFLGLCEVHILFTKYIIQELANLFLATLWLFVFWQGLKRDSRKLVLLSGVVLGLGLLTKETIFFLVPTAFVFLLVSRSYRRWLRRKEIYLSLLLAFVILSPNFYWNWRHNWFDYKLASGYVAPLSFAGFAAELFLGWFTHLRGSDILYGYDYMGPVAGCLATVGVLLAFGKVRQEFIKLIVVAFWIILGASFFLAAGLPRHYAVAIVPASVLAGVFAGTLWDQGLARMQRLRAVRVFILLTFAAMAIFSVKATADFNHYWVSQSSIPLSDWHQSGEIDLTTLSKAFIPLAQKYEATLAVFPAPALDATGAYFTAYSNIPSIGLHATLRWLEYEEEDLERIVFFLTPKDNLRRFRDWAQENDYPLPEVSRDEIIVQREMDNLDFRFPVRILVMTRKDPERHPTAQDLVQLVYGR